MGCNTSTISALPKQADPPKEAADITETKNNNDVHHSSGEHRSELAGDTKEHTQSSRFKSPPPITDAENPHNGNRKTVLINKIGFDEQQGTNKSDLVQEEQLSSASVSDESKNFSSSSLIDNKSSSLSTQEKKDAVKNEVVEMSVNNIMVDEQSFNPAQQVMDLPSPLPLEPTNQNSSPRDIATRFGSKNSHCHNIGEESPEIKENQKVGGTQNLEKILHNKDKQSSMEKSCEVVYEVPPVESSSAYEIEMEHSELEQRPSSQVHPNILRDSQIQDSNSVGNVNQLQSAPKQEELNQSDIDQSKSLKENARNDLLAGQSKSLLEQETQDQPCVNQPKSLALQEAVNLDSVCRQERFNQGLRSFCRLVDSKELLELADPRVSVLSLERAPAGQCFQFKNFLLKLTGITELNLSGNQLGPQAFRVVAMAVCHNKTIQSLDLSNNFSDTDSSECLGKMLSMNSSLINLNVSSNQLGKDFFSRCVGPALGCNKTLKRLSASSCGISNLNVLLENLLHKSSLEELDVSHNHMTNSQDFAQRLKEVLQSPSCSLKTLQLRNCGIGNEGMRLLLEALGLNTSLEMLHAGGNTVGSLSELTSLIASCIKHPTMKVCNISDTSVASQEPTLVVNGNQFGGSTGTQSLLTSLNVAKCSLTDDIITSLANNMPGCLPHLSELDLTGNAAITAVAMGTLSTLLTVDGQPSNLKHLHVGTLSIIGLSSILQGSSTWAMLHTLDLKRSKVTPSEVGELGLLCQKPYALMDLCLEGLKLSGSDALIGLLASSGSKCILQSLSLASCALQDSDLQPIATAVSKGLAIHSLKLSANRITDKGAVSLMESFLSIGDVCSLVELNLSNNRLTDESADTAAKMLVSMPLLRSLLLGHNSLSGDGLTTILTALNISESSSLRILDVSSQDSHLDETDLVDLLSLVAAKLGYKVEEGNDGMAVLGRSPLPSHPHGLTIRLAGLGGSPDNGQYLDSVTVKTDYTRSQSPSLSLQHVLEIADWLKGSLTTGGTGDCSMTAEEWSQVIGLAKDPSVPSWLQVSAHRSHAIYLTGLPASVSAGKLEGDLESEADCLVKEVCIMKDFIQRKPNGIAWVLLADDESMHKALNYFYEGKALMFSQPFMISCIKLSVNAKDSILEDEKKASRDLAARARETARDDAEHRALLESSYQASQERHEYAKANPAYADGRIW